MPELTFGQKAVGLTFNPSGDPKVQKLKELYAEIIDIVEQSENCAEPIDMRTVCHAQAITTAMDAQMWAVKAVTFRA